jgi:hypothetical protein
MSDDDRTPLSTAHAWENPTHEYTCRAINLS